MMALLATSTGYTLAIFLTRSVAPIASMELFICSAQQYKGRPAHEGLRLSPVTLAACREARKRAADAGHAILSDVPLHGSGLVPATVAALAAACSCLSAELPWLASDSLAHPVSTEPQSHLQTTNYLAHDALVWPLRF
jgi:hypothetical protein